MKTTTITISPIVAALVKAEDILGEGRVWQSLNDAQKHFLDTIFLSSRYEAPMPEIRSLASWSYTELNRFLKDNGYTIQLDPFFRPDFGVVSLLEFALTWAVAGEATSLYTNGKNYPAALFTAPGSVQYFKSASHAYPIGMLKTKSEDVVYMTRLDERLTPFELLSRTELLSRSLEYLSGYSGLMVPMVDLNDQPDISWLLQMSTYDADGALAYISQALQETTFKMNNLGVEVRSAVAIAVSKAPRPTLVIDGPFLLWIQRPGYSKPLFVGHIREDAWKDPQMS